jgi:hypothetical protein
MYIRVNHLQVMQENINKVVKKSFITFNIGGEWSSKPQIFEKTKETKCLIFKVSKQKIKMIY